jgi:hypothetical protein
VEIVQPCFTSMRRTYSASFSKPDARIAAFGASASSAGIETTALDGQSGLAYIKRTPTLLKSEPRHVGV